MKGSPGLERRSLSRVCREHMPCPRHRSPKLRLARHWAGQPSGPTSGAPIWRTKASASRTSRAGAELLVSGWPHRAPASPPGRWSLTCVSCPSKPEWTGRSGFGQGHPGASALTTGLAQVLLRHLSTVLNLGPRSLRGLSPVTALSTWHS